MLSRLKRAFKAFIDDLNDEHHVRKFWANQPAPAPAPSYQTDPRTEPIRFEIEMAVIPRLPLKPEDVSDALFKEAVDSALKILGNQQNIVCTYWPRQKDLTIKFPDDRCLTFLYGEPRRFV